MEATVDLDFTKLDLHAEIHAEQIQSGSIVEGEPAWTHQ